MSDHLYLTPEELLHVPTHVAVIMDGNGRWAQAWGLPRTAGHKAGSETFRRAAEYMADVGVKYFTVYAFSTENWKRPAEEVSAIMFLFEKYLNEAIESMAEKNIRLRFWGDVSVLPRKLLDLIDRTNAISREQTGLCVNVCLNYGGRQEIVRAAAEIARRAAAGELGPEDITEQVLSDNMYSAGTPDPDLIIRPGREKRISNFLLWQCAYSEFYFTDKLWPDMTEEDLAAAMKEYMHRKRRFGGV